MSDMDTSFFYNSQDTRGPIKTNAEPQVHTHDPTGTAWGHHPHAASGYPPDAMSLAPYPNWQQQQQHSERSPPYPHDPPRSPASERVKRSSQSETDSGEC